MSKLEDSRPRKERIDKLVVERGLAETRSKAQALIMAAQVVVDDHVAQKPGQLVAVDAEIRLKGEPDPYVSRAGSKLAGAFAHFAASEGGGITLSGRVAMDVGASTGGFTDVLLQGGAARVYAVDVGYGQLAWKLASDPRVVVMDRTNIRQLELGEGEGQLPERVSLVVADCSFISLRKVLPALPPLMQPGGDLVALVKPQFEVGPEGVGKGGIVRDPEMRKAAQREVVAAGEALGFDFHGACESSVSGRHGNRESLVWLRWRGESDRL